MTTTENEGMKEYGYSLCVHTNENRESKKGMVLNFASQVVVFILSLLKLFIPSSIRDTGEELFMDVINAFDYRLIPWVFVLNIIGYWTKKMNLPKWVPPTPLLLMLASFLICTGFGWAHTDVVGAKAIFVSIVEYGLGNGAIIAMLAIFGYDSVHAFTKRRGFSPKEKEAKE